METIYFFGILCFAFNFSIIFKIFQDLIFVIQSVILELQSHPPSTTEEPTIQQVLMRDLSKSYSNNAQIKIEFSKKYNKNKNIKSII